MGPQVYIVVLDEHRPVRSKHVFRADAGSPAEARAAGTPVNGVCAGALGKEVVIVVVHPGRATFRMDERLRRHCDANAAGRGGKPANLGVFVEEQFNCIKKTCLSFGSNRAILGRQVRGLRPGNHTRPDRRGQRHWQRWYPVRQGQLDCRSDLNTSTTTIRSRHYPPSSIQSRCRQEPEEAEAPDAGRLMVRDRPTLPDRSQAPLPRRPPTAVSS
jgi:hypothetical protein